MIRPLLYNSVSIVTVLHCTLKNDEDGTFYMGFSVHKKGGIYSIEIIEQ